MNNPVTSPFFSVIIPTFNRADCIPGAIMSVLSQTFKHFEIIVIDDGSADNTQEVVAAIHDDRLRLIHKNNEERSIARNTGIQQSEGQYIAFLDSDDTFYTHHLEEAYSFITEKNYPEVFHLGYEVIDSSGRKFPALNNLPELLNDTLILSNPLSCNGIFIRRDVALANRFIHHNHATYAEDTELWIRLAARFPFYHVPVVTSSIHMHENRSAVIVRPFNLLKSTLLIQKSLWNDIEVIKRFGVKKVQRFLGKRFLLAAMVFSSENKRWALRLLRRSLSLDRSLVGHKSFWVIIRNLISR